jgi:hypothetical protein
VRHPYRDFSKNRQNLEIIEPLLAELLVFNKPTSGLRQEGNNFSFSIASTESLTVGVGFRTT